MQNFVLFLVVYSNFVGVPLLLLKMASKQEILRKRVYNFYFKHFQVGKRFTVDHFVQEGESRSTIFDILQRYENGLPPERASGSGRKAKIFTKKKVVQLQKMFDHKDGVSTRKAAQKFNCSQAMIRQVLAKKTTIRYRKKEVIPDRTEDHKSLAQSKCGKLIRKFTNRSFILDDESYFTLSHSTINGNGGFYTSDKSATPADVKFAKKKKFEGKVLVWIAMGPKGLSQSLIRKSGFAINAETYLNECLRRRLIPYIRANYSEDEYVFWPDQASSHYAKIVLDHLREQKIKFVEKADNPANVPEIRPIEDFWAILKGAVYANAWRAKTVDQLINRIKYCLKNIDQSRVQKLARVTRKRIREVRDFGVVETR